MSSESLLSGQEDPGQGDASADEELGLADVAAGLTAESLVVLPFYHELRNALVRPERVKLQTEYFWHRWVPLLGPVRALIVMRMRQFGYYNRQTGELRDEVARTYDEIARSIGISTRSLERYFESEPDPGGGPFRVLKDPLLARFIRLRHQYVWRPGKSAPERTTNEYKIAMDEPLTPDDEAALRLAAARRLRHAPTDEREGRLGSPRAGRGTGKGARKPHTRQSGAYVGRQPGEGAILDSGERHTRQDDGYASPAERQSVIADSPDEMAAQPVRPLGTKQRPLEPVHSPPVNSTASGHGASLEEAVATFAAANSREASPLERQLLAGLIEEFDSAARARGETGARWVLSAIVEAVESGSRYVAPRRIREICRRWAASSPGGTAVASPSSGEGRHEWSRSRPRGAARPAASRPAAGNGAASAPPTEHGGPADSDGGAGETPEPPAVPTFLVDPALGLNNRQLWAAVLDELRRSVSPGTYSTWLKPTRLIGVEPDGSLVVGVPNSFARDWLGERFAASTEAAIEVVLGRRRGVRFEVEREWLALHPSG